MTPEEAILYIENFTWSTTRLGLERTRELLRGLGDPQKQLRFIHVAGSNGKGSTCAMLAAIFRASGYRVGLYTSPYIQEFRERIQINGENIPAEKLAEMTDRVRCVADAMADHPSQFELITAVGMLYFLEEKVDLVILEVGMGGDLDSTNAIDAPECAVITNIGLDHTEYLGSTVSEIAATKAGILKRGSACALYDSSPEAVKVITERCRALEIPFQKADFRELVSLHESLDGQRFSYRGREYPLRLLGCYQLHNAAVVLETVDIMRRRGWDVPTDAVEQGLSTVSWPARMEVLSREPFFLLDGGHNPQCAEALVGSLRALLPGRKFTFLLGILADKDYSSVLDILLPLGREFICVTPPSLRALSGEELCALIRERGGTAEAADSVPDAIQRARTAAGADGAVIAFGSLYLAGAVRTAFFA